MDRNYYRFLLCPRDVTSSTPQSLHLSLSLSHSLSLLLRRLKSPSDVIHCSPKSTGIDRSKTNHVTVLRRPRNKNALRRRRKRRGIKKTRLNYFQSLLPTGFSRKAAEPRDRINGRVIVADFFRAQMRAAPFHHVARGIQRASGTPFSSPWARLASSRQPPAIGPGIVLFRGLHAARKEVRWSGRWSMLAFNDHRRRCCRSANAGGAGSQSTKGNRMIGPPASCGKRGRWNKRGRAMVNL